MDKTLGQIAYGAVFKEGDESFVPLERCSPDIRSCWESVAAAVAAAVKEEDARICELRARQITALQIGDADDLSNVMLRHQSVSSEQCGCAIRASIKP